MFFLRHILTVYFVLILEVLPRKFKHGSAQLFNDLRVSVYDSHERMSGYTYFGIIDFDEFLIPAGNKTIKEMLVSLIHNVDTPMQYSTTLKMTYFRCVIHVHKKEVWNKCYIASFSGIVMVQDIT